MEYRLLGGTGLRVSALGFGGAEIGYEAAPAADVAAIVQAALDRDVNVFDTAECYGESEALLGAALRDHRKRVLIFTKCGHASGLPGADWSPETLEASIERSLSRLGADYVDLLQLHSCGEEVLREGAVVDVLQRARAAGKTRFIGYSGDHRDARYAVSLGVFDTLQTSVNIADQESIAGAIPESEARGMGVIAKRPLANAAWKTGRRPENSYHHVYWDRLQDLRYEFLDGPLEEALGRALRFTLAVPGVSLAIAGSKNPARWEQNTRLLEPREDDRRLYREIRYRWAAVAKADWVGQT